ncbi:MULTISPECIES: acyltransferase [Streptomyces]|uniref:Acyltransferase n=1 Tax=Streptomyces luteosporeus TaxID=173856 RepID=A0ABN3TMN6_9ACTN
MSSGLSPSPARHRRAGGPLLPSLVGIRTVSATIVFVLHIIQVGVFSDVALSENLNTYFCKIGFVSVGFFFLLSGFILTWSAREGDRPLRFWRRRLARIYPSHLLVCAAALALLAERGTEPKAGDVIPSIFLVQAWTSNETVFWGINGPSWSLAGEVLFYLAFPLLLRLVRRIPARRLWLCAGGLVGAVVAVALVAHLTVSGEPQTPFIKASWEQQWTVFNHPAARMLDFTLGIVMARILQTGRWIRLPFPVAAATIVPGYLLDLWLPDTFGMVAPTVVPLALIVTSAAAADLAGRPTGFQGRAMVRMGEISFAFYLTHTLLIIFGPIGRSGHPWSLGQGLGLIALTYVLSLAVAWALCHGVERPLARRLGGRSGRPRTAPAAGAGAEGADREPKAGAWTA